MVEASIDFLHQKEKFNYESLKYFFKYLNEMENPRKNKKLVARVHERIKNQRKDSNLKAATAIIQKYSTIYITNDNLRGQSKIFGKSVQDAGIAQLRQFISYKGDNHGRKCVLVDSPYTTVTCSSCGSRTGPTGLNGLAVRNWVCSVCGTLHDRDTNSGKVVLNFGLGYNLANLESSGGAR